MQPSKLTIVIIKYCPGIVKGVGHVEIRVKSDSSRGNHKYEGPEAGAHL